MASIDPNEINITDEQHEEQKNSNDKLYEGQKDSTKKSPAEQISSEDHWRKWLESRNIKVIVSIDADTTKNGTVEAFCKTLVDILPAHTLLCAGKKDEAIDKIIGAEFKNHKTTTINRKDGEKSRDNQTDAKKCGLSMYYRQNRFLFENDKGYQKSSSPKDIHKMLQKNIHKTKTSINIIHIDFAGESAEECSGIEKKITENEIITEKQYKISHEAKKVPMDELLERLENIKMKPDKIEDNNPIYFGTKEMAEDQRCGLIGISILKCLMSAWHNRNEEEMVNIFKEQLLNDKDLLKEIVNQAFKGKIQTLKFDGVINESWIDNFIKKSIRR